MWHSLEGIAIALLMIYQYVPFPLDRMYIIVGVHCTPVTGLYLGIRLPVTFALCTTKWFRVFLQAGIAVLDQCGFCSFVYCFERSLLCFMHPTGRVGFIVAREPFIALRNLRGRPCLGLPNNSNNTQSPDSLQADLVTHTNGQTSKNQM